jgi:protein TonB
VLPPRGIAGNAKPYYPLAARQRHLEGRVVLRVEVSAAGEPTSVTVAHSSGHEVLDQAALGVVRHWRFNPATRGGEPVPSSADVPVQFRIEG